MYVLAVDSCNLYLGPFIDVYKMKGCSLNVTISQ